MSGGNSIRLDFCFDRGILLFISSFYSKHSPLFQFSLSDLCTFAAADDESENDSDEWQSTGRRSISLSSDVSALSCVSVMPSEELDRLLEDVKSLGDNTLQVQTIDSK